MGRDAKSVVRLTADERAVLDALVKAPRLARAKVWRARRLLNADVDGLAWTDAQIVAALDVSESTVQRLGCGSDSLAGGEASRVSLPCSGCGSDWSNTGLRRLWNDNRRRGPSHVA